MAKGVELASAYISLSVSTDKVPAQVKKALDGAGTDARKAGTRVGRDYAAGFESVVQKGMGAAMKVGMAGAAAVATAAVGGLSYTLFKGFDRYKTLDATAKRLGAMGKTADQVKSIMADVNAVVDGTPVALDAASAAATNFLQGGVKEGEELKRVIGAIADAAGASQQDFGDLALIFGQVMNKGKLQAEEMLQLNERGIGIQNALRKEFGWTGDELEKLSQDGAITFQQLIQAVDGSFGGMAKRAADSIEGATGQMRTAISRLGANLISAVFGDPLSTTEGPGAMAAQINKVTERLKDLNAWITANGDDVVGFFANAAMATVTFAQGVTTAFAATLDGIGFVVDAIGDTMGVMTRGVAIFQRLLNRFDLADELDRSADAMFGLGDGIKTAADQAWAANDKLNEMFHGIGRWKADAQLAARFTQDLGTAASKIAPQNWWGTTIIKAPTADEIAKIKQAGYEVRQIPGTKDIEIVPNTPKATAQLDAWREKENRNPVEPPVDPNKPPGDASMGDWRNKQAQIPVTPPVQPDLAAANTTMQSFVDTWTNTIIAPKVAPGTPGSTSGGPGGGPTNPLTAPFQSSSAQDTGGAILPQSQALKDRYTSWGFNDIGGYRAPDGFNEHSSGKAIDVMVPNWQNDAGKAAGTNVALDALRQPNTEYVIWRNEMWYPDGTRKPYSGYGNTSDPTLQHMDHVHIKTYDQGGLWPSGTLGFNATGKDEFVLTPEQVEELKKQGVDPNTMQHGTAQGAAPGPTAGFIPMAAMNDQPVGQGGFSSILRLGESAVHSLIDTGAQAAAMAATAAAASAGGGGAAAGPAISTGIQMGANAAKRGVSWLYDLGGIWGEALIEQVNPFGAPHWLGTGLNAQVVPDLGNFLPKPGDSLAEAKSVDPANPVDPATTEHGTGQGQPPGPAPTVQLQQQPQGFPAQQFRNIARNATTWEDVRPTREAPLIGEAYVADYRELTSSMLKAQRMDALTHQGRTG